MRSISIAAILFISLTISISSYCQEFDTIKLKTQATEMAESLLKGDYATLAKYTYPKVVAMMGGEENMLPVLTKAMEDLKSQGYTFKSVTVGLTPLKANAGKEIHALVSQKLVLGVPGGTLTANSYLLAITSDKGNTWHFVDTAKLTDMETIKSIFPDYNPDLKIPAKQPPIFDKNQ